LKAYITFHIGFNKVLQVHIYLGLEYVVASQKRFQLDWDLIDRGEKPSVLPDYPVDVADYELIDLFNWQDEVNDMISQLEFVRMVDVQTETIERYIREGKIAADLEVPFGDKRSFKYFKEATIENYAEQYGWELITPANMKDKFMDMVKTMEMSFSYKPVLLKAMLEHEDENGRALVENIVNYFINFYSARKEKGLVVEKKQSILGKGGYTKKDVEGIIFRNPFKRFEDMWFMSRCRDIEYVEFNKHVWKKLSGEEKAWIVGRCDERLEEYYRKRV